MKTTKIGKWFPFWINDIRQECNGYPLEFEAMYIRLLSAVWQNNGQIENDEQYLILICGATQAQWDKHKQALANLFVPGDGAWSHNLLREELNKADAISAQRTIASKKAHEARWKAPRANAQKATDDLMAKITKDGGAY